MKDDLEFIHRLEAARRQMVGPVVELRDVNCIVYGDHIARYIGREKGIICASCNTHNYDAQFCGNLTPGDWSGDKDYELPGEP